MILGWFRKKRYDSETLGKALTQLVLQPPKELDRYANKIGFAIHLDSTAFRQGKTTLESLAGKYTTAHAQHQALFAKHHRKDDQLNAYVAYVLASYFTILESPQGDVQALDLRKIQRFLAKNCNSEVVKKLNALW